MKKRALLLFLLAGLLVLCCGCASRLLQEMEIGGRTLPPISTSQLLPSGDLLSEQTISVVLYVPDSAKGRLVAEVADITVNSGESVHEATVQRLLERLTTTYQSVLGGQELRLQSITNAVEICGDLVTVSLGGSTRLLNNKQQFTLRMAITNTLTELGSVQYVDVLVNGRDEGLDLAGTVACGVLSRYPSGDIETFWSQVEGQISQSGSATDLSKTVALYFVTGDGQHLLPEIRNIVFSATTKTGYVEKIMDEMAKGSTSLDSSRAVIPPVEYLQSMPDVVSVPGTSYTLISLSFQKELDDYLTVMGGSRGMLFAALTYTLTSFIPGVDGVMFAVGGEPVTELKDMNGQELIFENGWMSRADFANFVGSECKLYFPTKDGSALIAVNRPVEQRLADNPRTLMRQLLLGPQRYDTNYENLLPIFSEGIVDADLLSLIVDDDLALINLSDAFAEACMALDEVQGRNILYSIINTITELRGVKRVQFFIEGEQQEFLNGEISTKGEFLRHPGLIRQ